MTPATTLSVDALRRLVPTEWGGLRTSVADLVRYVRPLFAAAPSRAAAQLVIPILATEAIWQGGDADLAEWAAQRLLLGGSLALGTAASGPRDRATMDLPLVLNAAADECMVVVPAAEGARHALVSTRSPSWRWGEPVRTTGFRGMAIAAARVVDAPIGVGVPRAADAGPAIVAALAVALGEEALRLAVGYARTRELYGATVWQIPHARSIVAEAFADLRAADAVASTAVAAIDASTADEAVGAARIVVPHLLSGAMRGLSVLFGSTFFARVEPWERFEMLVRDVAALPLLGLGSARPAERARAVAVLEARAASADHPPELRDAVSRTQARLAGRRPALATDAIASAVRNIEASVDQDQPITDLR